MIFVTNDTCFNFFFLLRFFFAALVDFCSTELFFHVLFNSYGNFNSKSLFDFDFRGSDDVVCCVRARFPFDDGLTTVFNHKMRSLVHENVTYAHHVLCEVINRMVKHDQEISGGQ